MQEFSFQSILGEEKLSNKIYLVTNERDKPIYVGMTEYQSVAGRLAIHIANVFLKGERASEFSKYLVKNHPEYFNWKVKIYSINEIAELTKKNIKCLRCAERELYEYLKEKNSYPVCNKIAPRRCKNLKLRGGCV
jgi:hypothetical protein